MSVFRLPDLGEGLQEAEIVAWHVAVGDHVVADQPLVSVETAKAVVEIPSPQSGTVAALHGEPGATVAVGAPLVSFGEGAGALSETVVGELPQPRRRRPNPHRRTGRSGPPCEAAPAVRRRAQALGVDLAALAGSGPAGAVTIADVERAPGATPAVAGGAPCAA
ncbi:MAG: biotin/lipoyl-containing protein [Alphaproteobacteria bacterium]